MKREVAQALRLQANYIALALSNKERDGNLAPQEDFYVSDIEVFSEDAAAVSFRKEPTEKEVVAFFYWHNSKWWNFIPTDGHLVGMQRFPELKAKVEAMNFKKNFPKEE